MVLLAPERVSNLRASVHRSSAPMVSLWADQLQAPSRLCEDRHTEQILFRLSEAPEDRPILIDLNEINKFVRLEDLDLANYQNE